MKKIISGGQTGSMLKTVYTSLDELATEISREIVTDLRNNVATKSEMLWGGYTFKEMTMDLWEKINSVDHAIDRKARLCTNRWLVTSPEIANLLFAFLHHKIMPKQSIGLYKAGEITQGRFFTQGRFNVYVDPLYPTGHVLVGRTTPGDCYTFCPYIPVSYLENGKIMTRRAKRLTREGMKNYGSVRVEDFKCS